MKVLFSIALPSSSFVLMAVLKPLCVESEDYYYEALVFSRHSINLELDEENMMPEKGYHGAQKRRNKTKYHENEEMVPGTRSPERQKFAYGNG